MNLTMFIKKYPVYTGLAHVFPLRAIALKSMARFFAPSFSNKKALKKHPLP